MAFLHSLSGSTFLTDANVGQPPLVSVCVCGNFRLWAFLTRNPVFFPTQAFAFSECAGLVFAFSDWSFPVYCPRFSDSAFTRTGCVDLC